MPRDDLWVQIMTDDDPYFWHRQEQTAVWSMPPGTQPAWVRSRDGLFVHVETAKQSNSGWASQTSRPYSQAGVDTGGGQWQWQAAIRAVVGTSLRVCTVAVVNDLWKCFETPASTLTSFREGRLHRFLLLPLLVVPSCCRSPSVLVRGGATLLGLFCGGCLQVGRFFFFWLARVTTLDRLSVCVDDFNLQTSVFLTRIVAIAAAATRVLCQTL